MAVEERIYLDYNATAPVRPEVAEGVVRALGSLGNPSSVHAEGRAMRRMVEAARESVAALVGADPANVAFTSGGTEANNGVLCGARIRQGQPASLLLSAVEHASVLSGHRFPPENTLVVPVDRSGIADLRKLAAMLETPQRPALVSIQLANSETGVIQPVPVAAALAHERGHVVHSDVVQAAGKLSIDLDELGADAITLSAHKIGGPQGVGAIVLRGEGIALDPWVRGGGQERSRRGGTENVPGIVGFGIAAEISRAEIDENARKISGLRDSLEAGLLTISPEAVVMGAETPRLPNTTCFALPGLHAETAVIAFDLEGVAVSSGSACSSGKVAASHVIRAMGRDDLARGAIRASLGWRSSAVDVARFLEVWRVIYEGVARRRSRAA